MPEFIIEATDTVFYLVKCDTYAEAVERIVDSIAMDDPEKYVLDRMPNNDFTTPQDDFWEPLDEAAFWRPANADDRGDERERFAASVKARMATALKEAGE